MDILCVQETWLLPGGDTLQLGGYQFLERRRGKGIRGGIGMFIRNGIEVKAYRANEFVQRATLLLPGGGLVTVGNVYIPPRSSLAKRAIDEDMMGEMVLEGLG